MGGSKASLCKVQHIPLSLGASGYRWNVRAKSESRRERNPCKFGENKWFLCTQENKRVGSGCTRSGQEAVVKSFVRWGSG